MISALVKPDAGRRDGEMFAIEPAIRSTRQERQRRAGRLPHHVVDRSGEPEPFATFLISEDHRHGPRVIDLEREHENRRAVFVTPPNEWHGEIRSVERPFYGQDRDSSAVAENASAESCEHALHWAGL